MTLDPEAQRFLDFVAASGREELHKLDPAEARRQFDRFYIDILGGAPEPLAQVEDRTIPGPAGAVPVRIYRPDPAARAAPALLYAHGGGWVLGGLDTHDALCRKLARSTPCTVVAVDYRRAPEHRCPAALEDVLAAYRWLRREGETLGADRARIAVGGDSAGGNLVAAAAIALRDAGERPPCFQLLLYPVADLRMATPSYERCAEGYLLTSKGMAWFVDHYLGGGDPADPRASPLCAADLAGLPPALVVTAGYDVLGDEGAAYAERLAAAGVAARHSRYPEMIHGFAVLPFAAAQRVLAESAAALAAAFEAGG